MYSNRVGDHLFTAILYTCANVDCQSIPRPGHLSPPASRYTHSSFFDHVIDCATRLFVCIYVLVTSVQRRSDRLCTFQNGGDVNWHHFQRSDLGCYVPPDVLLFPKSVVNSLFREIIVMVLVDYHKDSWYLKSLVRHIRISNLAVVRHVLLFQVICTVVLDTIQMSMISHTSIFF